ncbi:MAG: AbrB/MazE/SpoVT family DNA-binding domain-containing protein [Sphingomonadaceae bacterium]
MNSTFKIIEFGDSVGVILPEDALAHLQVGVGDTLYVTDTENGILLSKTDPEFAEQMEIAERIMEEDRAILAKLAKS